MTPKRTRRRYTAEFKFEVALASLTERQSLADLAAHYQLASAQIARWKLQLRQQAAQAFAEAPVAVAPAPDVEPLYAAIGRLQMENALLKKRCSDEHGPTTRPGSGPGTDGRLGAGSLPGPGPSSQQLLLPVPEESAQNLQLMRLLDEEFTRHNFKGVLGLRDHLRLAGHAVNAKRVRRLVRLTG